MRYDYVPIDRVFSKVTRDVTSDFNEIDVVEWTGEALEHMGTAHSYEEAVAFIEVKNFTARMPKFTHNIIQIARNNFWTPKTLCPTPATCIAEMPNLIYQPTSKDGIDNGYVVIDCIGQPLVEYDVAYYRPYFDLKLEYYGWTNSSYYRKAYTPVRLSNNSFFNSLVCQEKDASNIYYSSRDEYKPIGKSTLRLSFECGSIAVAYNRAATDSITGYPLVPDSVSHLEAITSYVAMKLSKKDFFSQRDGSKGKKDDYERDWQWYCGQATSKELMPQGVDELQNITDSRRYLLPREHYYSYFGNLSKPEDRKFDDPDSRNHKFYTFS